MSGVDCISIRIGGVENEKCKEQVGCAQDNAKGGLV